MDQGGGERPDGAFEDEHGDPEDDWYIGRSGRASEHDDAAPLGAGNPSLDPLTGAPRRSPQPGAIRRRKPRGQPHNQSGTSIDDDEELIIGGIAPGGDDPGETAELLENGNEDAIIGAAALSDEWSRQSEAPNESSPEHLSAAASPELVDDAEYLESFLGDDDEEHLARALSAMGWTGSSSTTPGERDEGSANSDVDSSSGAAAPETTPASEVFNEQSLLEDEDGPLDAASLNLIGWPQEAHEAEEELSDEELEMAILFSEPYADEPHPPSATPDGVPSHDQKPLSPEDEEEELLASSLAWELADEDFHDADHHFPPPFDSTEPTRTASALEDGSAEPAPPDSTMAVADSNDGGSSIPAPTNALPIAQLYGRSARQHRSSDDDWAADRSDGYDPPADHGYGGGDDDDGGDPYADIDQPLPDDAAQRQRTRSLVRELVETGLLALLVFLAVRGSFQNFKVDGNSMYPTLEDGQFLIVNKLIYSEVDLERLSNFVPFIDAGDDPTRHVFHPPERGDIIVLRDPSNPNVDLIKRVIGLPGDKLEIFEGAVYINDYRLEEPYIQRPWSDSRPAVLVPENHYFVLGDNRDNSKDSRSSAIGFIPGDLIIGRAELSYWPFSQFGRTSDQDPTISDVEGRPVITTQRIDH